MKEKIVLSISIGCAALILTMVMFTQFKTIEETDIVAIETMRETELRTELADWKTKYEEVETKLDDTNNKIDEYKTQMTSKENATALLEQEYEESQKYLGYTDVKGEGIIITLEDSNNSDEIIDRFDLVSLVNELKLAGAEAVSINDERIVGNTDIALVNDTIILVNGRRISGPYTVKAIGNKKLLESSLIINGGYISELKNYNKKIDYTIEDEVFIKKFEGTMSIDYMKVDE